MQVLMQSPINIEPTYFKSFILELSSSLTSPQKIICKTIESDREQSAEQFALTVDLSDINITSQF